VAADRYFEFGILSSPFGGGISHTNTRPGSGAVYLLIRTIWWVEKHSSVVAAVVVIETPVPLAMENSHPLESVGELMEPRPRDSARRSPHTIAIVWSFHRRADSADVMCGNLAGCVDS